MFGILIYDYMSIYSCTGQGRGIVDQGLFSYRVGFYTLVSYITDNKINTARAQETKTGVFCALSDCKFAYHLLIHYSDYWHLPCNVWLWPFHSGRVEIWQHRR